MNILRKYGDKWYEVSGGNVQWTGKVTHDTSFVKNIILTCQISQIQSRVYSFPDAIHAGKYFRSNNGTPLLLVLFDTLIKIFKKLFQNLRKRNLYIRKPLMMSIL